MKKAIRCLIVLACAPLIAVLMLAALLIAPEKLEPMHRDIIDFINGVI